MSSGRSSAYNESIDRRPFEWFGGAAAVATAAASIAYAITFVALDRVGINDFLLLAGAVLAIPVFVALYERLRGVDGGFALLALLLGVLGSYGAAVHGGWDLANSINEPDYVFGGPFAADPRGLATFAFTGAAVLLFSWLLRREARLPARLGLLGYLLGALMLALYLARLIVLDDDDFVVAVPAALTGLVVSPAWYAWLGRELLRSR